MAINRLVISGYAQVELNRVTFPITGRVISDLPLKSTFTTSAPAENGMLLAFNYVTGEVTLPTGTGDLIALHFSPEKEYDPNLSGLNKFKLVAGGQYPRLGILSVGEKFHDNCLSYDTAVFADNAAALAALAAYKTTPVYGIPATDGTVRLVATLAGTEPVVLQVIGKDTMANGDIGVKFVVIKAQ